MSLQIKGVDIYIYIFPTKFKIKRVLLPEAQAFLRVICTLFCDCYCPYGSIVVPKSEVWWQDVENMAESDSLLLRGNPNFGPAVPGLYNPLPS